MTDNNRGPTSKAYDLMQMWANKERLSNIKEASNISSLAKVVDQVNLKQEVCVCAVHQDQTIVDGLTWSHFGQNMLR